MLSSETVPFTVSPVLRPPISVSTCLNAIARAAAAEKYAEAALYLMLAVAHFTHAPSRADLLDGAVRCSAECQKVSRQFLL